MPYNIDIRELRLNVIVLFKQRTSYWRSDKEHVELQARDKETGIHAGELEWRKRCEDMGVNGWEDKLNVIEYTLYL